MGHLAPWLLEMASRGASGSTPGPSGPPLPQLSGLLSKESEQRALCGSTQPQESYDFMSPWLLSLDKLSSPQDHALRS